MHRQSLLAVTATSIILTMIVPTPPASLSQETTITVSKSVIGVTPLYIGATEGGYFSVSDLTDSGINTYRIWIGMSDVEYCDDDDPGGYIWECDRAGNPQYGAPTVAEIKDNPNIINWENWDLHINDPSYRWRTGSNPDTAYGEMVSRLTQNGILPILGLRNRDEYDLPNWAPDPAFDEDDVNEWWQYCFSVAYWFNVRNTYGITHFQVHNEPDLSTQGWHGTQAEYVELVQIAYDALKTANDLAGIDTVIMSPVESQMPFPRTYTYFADVLDAADSEIQIADFHWYHMNGTYPLSDLEAAIDDVSGQIATHNPDGVMEPLWVSEYGNFSSPCEYDTIGEALLTARQLLIFSRKEVEGVNIFPFYDWGTVCGLVRADGAKTETYYAYRLMTRALVGGKERLGFTTSGVADEVMVAKDAEHIYVAVLNGGGTVSVDLSDLRLGSATATIWEYSSTHKDEIVATTAISGGQFSFSAPSNGIALARIPFVVTYFPLVTKARGN